MVLRLARRALLSLARCRQLVKVLTAAALTSGGELCLPQLAQPCSFSDSCCPWPYLSQALLRLLRRMWLCSSLLAAFPTSVMQAVSALPSQQGHCPLWGGFWFHHHLGSASRDGQQLVSPHKVQMLCHPRMILPALEKGHGAPGQLCFPH